jgi:hypothetical protein
MHCLKSSKSRLVEPAFLESEATARRNRFVSIFVPIIVDGQCPVEGIVEVAFSFVPPRISDQDVHS